MIYKYPEEFIVPVIYVNDLKDKTNYRGTDSKSLHVGKLLMSDEELQEDEIIQENIDNCELLLAKDINFFNIEEEILQESIIKEDRVKDNLDYESMKDILRDIDEDYENRETLNI